MTDNQARSVFDKSQGLGSAREGVGHWWMQRVTAIALIPLTLWFAGSVLAHAVDDYAAFKAWLHAPLAAIPMVLLLIALFYHMALGLQVVAEDYLHHERVRIPAVIAIDLGSFALATSGIIATLRIFWGG